MLIDKADINMNEIEGKVAVVTGAGQGIGKETARILAYLGASVVIAEINDTGKKRHAWSKTVHNGNGNHYIK